MAIASGRTDQMICKGVLIWDVRGETLLTFHASITWKADLSLTNPWSKDKDGKMFWQREKMFCLKWISRGISKEAWGYNIYEALRKDKGQGLASGSSQSTGLKGGLGISLLRPKMILRSCQDSGVLQSDLCSSFWAFLSPGCSLSTMFWMS